VRFLDASLLPDLHVLGFAKAQSRHGPSAV